LITFENNFLFSKEWNNSEQFFVNNIIDKHDEIAKQVFPKNWIYILSTENSVKRSIAYINNDYFIFFISIYLHCLISYCIII
jgi:hypothetical protein